MNPITKHQLADLVEGRRYAVGLVTGRVFLAAYAGWFCAIDEHDPAAPAQQWIKWLVRYPSGLSAVAPVRVDRHASLARLPIAVLENFSLQ